MMLTLPGVAYLSRAQNVRQLHLTFVYHLLTSCFGDVGKGHRKERLQAQSSRKMGRGRERTMEKQGFLQSHAR